jgi:2'-hydroxyisoflavone reductase
MNLLILGGTVFLGRHLVQAALSRGHRVTLFNRGQHNPDLFPDVERLHGDRDGGLDSLHGRGWDAVIDTCGYVPRIVRQSAELLSGAVGHYTFISSLSVFSDTSKIGITDTDAVSKLEDESVEELTGETYGPLKALCEQAVENAVPGRTLIIRPGLIVGPDDPSDRFTYWPHRIAAGGIVLAPGRPDETVQFIDVRDLAQWTIAMVERNETSIFNATGPEPPVTFGRLIEDCVNVSGGAADVTWIDETFLLAENVTPWVELPLWIPVETDPSDRGFSAFDCRKAVDAGLSFRSIKETIRDTLEWDSNRPSEGAFKNCLSRKREAELLAKWRMAKS